jgi:hypothetical protein
VVNCPIVYRFLQAATLRELSNGQGHLVHARNLLLVTQASTANAASIIAEWLDEAFPDSVTCRWRMPAHAAASYHAESVPVAN